MRLHPHMRVVPCSKVFQIIIEINRGSLHQHPMRRVNNSSHYIASRQSLGLRKLPNEEKPSKMIDWQDHGTAIHVASFPKNELSYPLAISS